MKLPCERLSVEILKSQILKLCFKFYYNISFEGLENIPKEGGYIYASNHRSYADPVFIALNVPKKFSFMAKEELFKNFFFGRLIKLNNQIIFTQRLKT